MTNNLREFGKLLLCLYVIVGVGQELKRLADNVNSGNLEIDLRSLQEAFDRALEQSRARYASRQTAVNSEVLGTNLLADPTKSILMESKPTKPFPDPQTVEASKWLRLIPHPSIVIILGGRGKGKSALGYRLLEYLRWVASVYVVGLPESARKLLPDYVGMVASLEDVPPNSIVLVDEGYLTYHARRSMAATSVEMSQTLNLSRQRNQTLIFVTQEARQIDRNIASSANVVIFKDLGILQLEFDRRELNKIALKATQAFATLGGDKRKWAYVYSPDANFMGLMGNSLSTFWIPKLSHIFATGGEVIPRAPKKTPLSQRIEKAKELKQQRLSLGQIAKLMGVSKSTIKNYLEGYPYKH
ncbi:hypothetical protein ES703_44050 [subsurface metagenome]